MSERVSCRNKGLPLAEQNHPQGLPIGRNTTQLKRDSQRALSALKSPKTTVFRSCVSNLRTYGSLTDQSKQGRLYLKLLMRGHSNNFISPLPAQWSTRAVPGHSRTGRTGANVAAMPLPSAHPFLHLNQIIWQVLNDTIATLASACAKRQQGMTKWTRHWNPTQIAPVNKKESLCVAYRAHAVDGCKELESTNLLEETGKVRTLDRNVNSHDWQEENVLILDQQAATHGNNSRPFGKACNPSSIRADQRPEDGFEEMRAKP